MDSGLRLVDLPAAVPLGGQVRGRVVAPSGSAGDITVSLVFETGGSCDSEQATLRHTVVRRTDSADAADFVLEAPAWPPTYRGHLFHGCWYLLAVAGGESARQELVVTAPPGPPEIRVRQPQRSPGSSYARRLRRLAILGLLLAACVAVMVVGLSRGDTWWLLGLVAGLVLLPPTIGTVLGVLAVRAAGEFTVSGEAIDGGLAVRATVGDPSRVTAVTATLVGRERAQRLSGLDNREQHEHVFHERVVRLASDGVGGYAGTVPVPVYPEVPYTVSHSTAQVGWSVHVTAAITGAPDQTRTLVLLVLPAGGGAVAEPKWTTG